MCRKLSFLLSFVLVLGLAGNAWGLLLAEKDIGEPVLAGSAMYDDVNDRWVVLGAGADIGGSADQFYYVFRPLGNSGVLKVNLASQQITSSKALAGVMIRDGLNGDSRHVMMAMTGTEGNRALWRTIAGGGTDTETWPGLKQKPPKDMWVSRNGNTVTATFWYQPVPTMPMFDHWHHEAVNIPMSTDVYIGLVVSSHNIGELGEAVFEDVVWPAAPYPKAWNPFPADGAPQVPGDVILQWLPGDTAVTHDVYIGTDPNALLSSAPVCEDLPLAQTSCNPGTLEGGATYYWQVVEDDGVTEHPGPVWSFYKTYFVAHGASPADGAGTVPLDVTLTWLPGDTTASHEVYFGTAPAALNIVAVRALGDESYTPDTLLEATTYYWQVIEVEADGVTKYPSEVWSFTTLYLKAYNPSPADGERRVSLTPILNWTTGDTAATHEVYLGIHPAALAHVATLALGDESYEPDANNIDPDTDYYWQVVEVEDDGTTEHTGDVWSFRTIRVVTGTIRREVWEGIDDTSVSDLTGHPDYPCCPTWTDELTLFDSPGFADSYGARIIGYLVPETSGDYTFWIASDDASELWLSTSEEPRGAVNIAGVSGWSGYHDWDRNPEQESELISLVANKKYYIMALWKEGGGGDHCSVAWEGPDISRDVIDGYYLMPFDYLWAWAPSPKDGAESVPIEDDVTLSWLLGKDALLHAVYFGDNYEDVLNGEPDTYKGLQYEASYVAGMLDAGKTYYWAVDTVWQDGRDFDISIGAVWSFTTENYRIVENFESYGVAPELLPEQGITVEALPPPAPPVAEYTFDNGDANDSSGNELHGTLIDDANASTGELVLDGDGDYVDINNPAELNFSTGDWSVCALVKMSSVDGTHVIYANGGDGSGGCRIMLSMGEGNEHKITLTVDDNSSKREAKGGTIVDDDMWHHVIGVREGDTIRVYVDGKPDGSTDLPADFDLSGTAQANAYIGTILNYGNGELQKFYNGTIDDVQVYDYALSEGEARYMAGLGHVYGPMVAYYEFEDSAGDSTLNNYDGAEQGSPVYVGGKINQAIALDGGDCVHVDDADIATGSLSIALWCKYDVLPWQWNVLMNDDGWDPGAIHFPILDNGRVNIDVHSVVGLPGETQLEAGEWYHVAATFDTTDEVAKLYINGEVDGESTGFGGATPWVGPMAIGGWNSGSAYERHFNGCIDDFQVYDTALSHGQVVTLAIEDPNPLYDTWVDDGSAVSSLEIGSPHWGEKAMKVEYTGKSETSRKYEFKLGEDELLADYTAGDVKALSIWFKGDPCNAGMTISVELEDLNVSAEVFHEDPNATTLAGWQEWHIDLRDFTDVNLASLEKIKINIGPTESMELGMEPPVGSGTMYFDDIRLYPTRCVPVLGPYGDITDDCTVDYDDLRILVDDYLEGDYTVSLPEQTQIGGEYWLYAAAPDDNDLLAHYEFEGDANDSSGNGRHGTLMANANVATGALKLDGRDDCVEIEHDDVFNPTSSGFSISVWVNIDKWNSNWQPIIAKRGESGVGWQVRRRGGSDKLVFTHRTAGEDDPQGSITPTLDEWHHVAAIWDGSNKKTVYLDAVKDREVTGVSSIKPCNHRVYIGARARGDNNGPEATRYQGMIDEVRIYSYGLSYEEVLYLSGVGDKYVPPIYRPLRLHYKFDGDANDSSSGFHGTEWGDPFYVGGVLGQGIDLDGSGDFVSSGGKFASDLGIDGANPRTVTAWVFTRAYNNGGIWDVGKRSSRRDFCLRTRGGDNQWRLQYWGGDKDFNYDSKNKWVHFALVYENSLTKMYADGDHILDFDKTLRTTNDYPFQVGCYGWQNNYFNGIIDDLRVYDYALAPLEVQCVYTNDDVYVPVESRAELYYEEPENSRKINLKDYAFIVHDWLETRLFPVE